MVLEYLPYRNHDVTRRVNNATGEKLAQSGIGYARVDIRGSGNSDGVLVGEYTRQEQPTASRSSPGSPRRPGAMAPSACAEYPGAASIPSRSQRSPRPS